MFADRIRFEPLISFDEAVARIAAVTGVVLVCGATDSGKTTLVLAAMNAAIRAGRRVAVLDTDPGQGEVGPPGTLGLTVPSDPVASLSERKPEALAFLGDITPAGHTLTLVQGACRLLHAGSARDAELVLIDTTGAVEGRWAEVLKLTKAAALRPVQIVLLHRGTELSRLARLFAGLLEAEILHVRSPAEARPRSPAYRKLMREARLRRHLKEARTHVLDAPALTVAGAW
ncbi:MAG: hypothetical protein FJX77_14765, partial [Armatimonadetes bacterium]|nr:hypothetical protein [Armatimonadota bacterium]